MPSWTTTVSTVLAKTETVNLALIVRWIKVHYKRCRSQQRPGPPILGHRHGTRLLARAMPMALKRQQRVELLKNVVWQAAVLVFPRTKSLIAPGQQIHGQTERGVHRRGQTEHGRQSGVIQRSKILVLV